MGESQRAASWRFASRPREASHQPTKLDGLSAVPVQTDEILAALVARLTFALKMRQQVLRCSLASTIERIQKADWKIVWTIGLLTFKSRLNAALLSWHGQFPWSKTYPFATQCQKQRQCMSAFNRCAFLFGAGCGGGTRAWLHASRRPSVRLHWNGPMPMLLGFTTCWHGCALPWHAPACAFSATSAWSVSSRHG